MNYKQLRRFTIPTKIKQANKTLQFSDKTTTTQMQKHLNTQKALKMEANRTSAHKAQNTVSFIHKKMCKEIQEYFLPIKGPS